MAVIFNSLRSKELLHKYGIHKANQWRRYDYCNISVTAVEWIWLWLIHCVFQIDSKLNSMGTWYTLTWSTVLGEPFSRFWDDDSFFLTGLRAGDAAMSDGVTEAAER